MEFKDVFTDLRKKAELSQNEVAEKVFVTRIRYNKLRKLKKG